MAETHVNFLAGSPLNRLSWLRTSTPFLSVVLANPETRWVLFRSGEPLVRVDKAKKSHSFAKLSTLDVASLLGPSPIFEQGKEPGEAAQPLNGNEEPVPHVEAARLHSPGIVFLGLHEPEGAKVEGSQALPSSDFSAKTDPLVAVSNISGSPYFSLDVSDVDKGILDEVLKDVSKVDNTSENGVEIGEPLKKLKEWRYKLQKSFIGSLTRPEDAPSLDSVFRQIEEHTEVTSKQLQYSKIDKVMKHVTKLDDDKVLGNNEYKFKARAEGLLSKWLPLTAKFEESEESSSISYEFMEPRAATTQFTAFDAAIFSEARSMADWNARNKFCPACGSPTYSLWAGWKLACSTLLPWADNTGKKPCPSAKGLNNFSHPRTDAVVIMAVTNETGDKILLGRNRKFPGNFYSCLAGFIEPGESFEDAVKREIWEEAGVQVWGVRYHSGQPWPYPASLMVGFYAFADSSKPVRVDLDNELIDARWFTREEVLAVLAHRQGTVITRQEYKVFDNHDAGKSKDQQNAEAAKRVESKEETLPSFRVPPSTAIAGVLIRDWANGKIGAGGWSALKKGNL